MDTMETLIEALRPHVRRERLLETAIRLIEVPSPTGDAGAVSDRLAEILAAEGFAVERIPAGHPTAPAVSVRFAGKRPGRTLQFNGHLDTVHLPFVPPAVANGLLTGSGASDMKAGVAAAVEALRALRDSGALESGAVLLTAHDLHEAPWGDGRQLDRMIRDGHHGDGVLIPEPLCNVLPVAGRGNATWKAVIRRDGPPVHEVMRPGDQPSVITAAAELIARLGQLEAELRTVSHPVCGTASVFIGQVHSGEIYNQYPQEAWLEGTRRWLPGTDRDDVARDFRARIERLAADTGTSIELHWMLIRDALELDENSPLAAIFQAGYRAISGDPLPRGPKPFVDDANSFSANARIPAITHGPRAGGQHTVAEWVDIDDLARVALLYAATAAAFGAS